MKINGLGDPGRVERPGSGKTEHARAPAGAKAQAEPVSLSELARHLQSLESELATTAPLDAAKVEEVKQAIREGRFRVNAEVVADRLIESMKELLARKP
jgi:negative regulator of flagellin synthesis FlgM